MKEILNIILTIIIFISGLAIMGTAIFWMAIDNVTPKYMFQLGLGTIVLVVSSLGSTIEELIRSKL